LVAIRHLLNKVDTVLVGGAMAYTFLKAGGHPVGSSLVEDAMLSDAKAIMETAAAAGKSKLMLPRDHICAKELAPNAFTTVFPDEIPGGWMGLDIGPQTITQFTGVLKAAKTIVWNGPMGVFETHPFEVGTRDVAMAIAKATAGGAVSIIGGGDSAAAVEAFGIVDRFTHVSTGGGASLQMLEGTPFDSLAVLDDA
jgi:phosphoglycerate kinase